MRPCDCIDDHKAMKCLKEQGITINDNSITVRNGKVKLVFGPVRLYIPLRTFKHFAEWFLEEQGKIRTDFLSEFEK